VFSAKDESLNLKATVAETEAKFKSQKRETDKLHRKLDLTERKSEDLQAEIASLKAGNQVQAEKAEEERVRKEIESKSTELQETITGLKEELDEKESQITSLKTQMANEKTEN